METPPHEERCAPEGWAERNLQQRRRVLRVRLSRGPYLHGPFFRQPAEPVLKRLSTSADNFLVLVEESLPGSQRVSARWISSCCVRRSSFARAQSPNAGAGRPWRALSAPQTKARETPISP